MGRYRSKPTPDTSSTEAALDAMDADELRALIREMLPWFDKALLARFANALVDCAARNGSGWVPPGPTDAVVKEAEAFAEAAKRVGYAEPSAASLALACAQVDGSTTGSKWLDSIRDEYRRYPALRRELSGPSGRT